MRYYLRGPYPHHRACAETTARAEVLAAQGWIEVERATYMAFWRRQDALWYQQQIAALPPPQVREREIGGPLP